MFVDQFSSGKVNTNDLILPINRHGHPNSMEVVYSLFGPGAGLHFESRNPMQTLAVMNKCYFCKVPFFKFGLSQSKLVKKIVDIWMFECVDQNKIYINLFDVTLIQDVMIF